MKISNLTQEERLYAAKQSQQLQGQTGAVQCTTAVFDENGLCLSDEKYHTPHDEKVFGDSFNDTIDQLLEDGFMRSRQDFVKYSKEHSDGVRIDNNGYTFITAFSPDNGSAKMFIYNTKLLNRHIREAERGITIVCGCAEFVIPDGGKIVVDRHDGREPVIRTARYIDSVHFELDNSRLGLFHKGEYAMILKSNGYTVTP